MNPYASAGSVSTVTASVSGNDNLNGDNNDSGIPRQNIRSLILPYEVEEAVRDGRFHIYAVSSIEEGMEIMTGLPAGRRNARGVFTPGSFNRMIEDRLKKLYESGKQG